MSRHNPHRGLPHRHPAHTAIWAGAAMIVILAIGACSSTTSTNTSAAVATAGAGPGGQKVPRGAGAGREPAGG